tara:strand:- start:433 stop:852 length:420 start_codon:yes stop_codon:yes gene_type:complete
MLTEANDGSQDTPTKDFAKIRDALNQLESFVPIWGSDPNNRRSLTEIRKSFRAIKLVATAKSLNIMAQVSDAAENLLNRVVDGTISLNVELIPLMDEIRAVLEHLVARAEKGQELDLHLADQLIEKADLLASGLETEKN